MTETLPDWLVTTAQDDPVPKYPRTQIERDLERTTFECLFERVLESVTEGRSAKHTVESDPRGVSYGRFMLWVNRDPERVERFEEAQKVSAEVMVEDMLMIADGADSLEDVQRSQLRVNVRKFRAQSYNRKKYGENKQIEQTVTIDLKDAMAKANERILAAREPRLIEGERVG